MFDKLLVIGVGLIGGSVALAARQRGLCRVIHGWGREQDRENLQLAEQRGVIDTYTLSLEEALAGADLVLLATPVGATEALLAQLRPWWRDGVIYSDVGSTKRHLAEAAMRCFGSIPANLVPAHPIAGAEQSGVIAALPDLFQDKRLILTPLPETDAQALQAVWRFWEALGARVSTMSVAHHDAIFAATSHLPHVLAFALTGMLGRMDEQNEIFQYAAGGFRDFTRIASSDPVMWRDICLANRDEIVALLRRFQHEIESLALLIESEDNQRLFDAFAAAKAARQRFLDQFNSP